MSFISQSHIEDQRLLDPVRGAVATRLRIARSDGHAERESYPFYRISKRFFDISVALLLIPFLIFFAFVLVIGNSIWNPGPLLFSQRRMGFRCRPFTIIKFRTMTAYARRPRGPEDPIEVERITPLGALLRRTHVDELPQILNILRGEMSLIGPRPDMLEHARSYLGAVPHYRARYGIRPGLTGLAQITLGYGAGSRFTTEKVRLDLAYRRAEGWRIDLMILRRTAGLIFAGKTLAAAADFQPDSAPAGTVSRDRRGLVPAGSRRPRPIFSHQSLALLGRWGRLPARLAAFRRPVDAVGEAPAFVGRKAAGAAGAATPRTMLLHPARGGRRDGGTAMAERAQAALGWITALSIALALAAFAAGIPVEGHLGAAVILALFLVQSALDPVLQPPAATGALRRLAILWLLPLAVMAVQLSLRSPTLLAGAVVAADDLGAPILEGPIGRDALARLAAYAMIFWMALRAAADGERAAAFVRGFALFSAAVALVGLLGSNTLAARHALAIGGMADAEQEAYRTFAIIGLLANLAALALAFDERSRHRPDKEPTGPRCRHFSIGAPVFTGGGLLLLLASVPVGPPGGLVMVGLGIASFAVLAWGRGTIARLGRHGQRAGILALILAAIASSIVSAHLAGDGLEHQRATLAIQLDGIAASPWLGLGSDRTATSDVPGIAGGFYVETAAMLGIPACIVFFAGLALIGRHLAKGAMVRRRVAAIPAFAFAVFVVGAAESVEGAGLGDPVIAALFAAVLGVGWAQSTPGAGTSRRST
ncbi:sugar transferase [Acuticoccus sp. M5D2P5]|uniref:sugar transferase n=1 Tax=Acuticoccus kalidii TaxID=2910977 RepID=UPI001F393CA1|nr:sugar transferase [Acuticoccus kalidii]MCF3933004.1 sugar transferase [Acuticoccus kalidii]